jgi:prepilin-type N-terminal cleavage/methylation domain-containing protein
MLSLKRSNRGFTLIELLVVIAIIGILASVVMASLNSAREKARNAGYVSQIKEYQKALELSFNDNNSYPGNASVWGCIGTGYAGGRCFSGAANYSETNATAVDLQTKLDPYINVSTIPGALDTTYKGAIYRPLLTGGYMIYYILAGSSATCSVGVKTGTFSDMTQCVYTHQ